MTQPRTVPRNFPPGTWGTWGLRLWDLSRTSLTPWTHAVLLIAAALLLFYYCASSKIPINDGFGWDGDRYARWVGTLSDDLAAHNIDRYYIKRILPSFLVSIPARVLGLPITRDYVVFGFCFANAACAYLAGLFWLRSCMALRICGTRALLGVVLLLFNFPVTTMSAYDGVLTDLFSLAASAAMLDCWIRNRPAYLAIAAFASMFCWPNAAIVATLLILFPSGSRLVMGRLSCILRRLPHVVALFYGVVCAHSALDLLITRGPASPIMWFLLAAGTVIATVYVLIVAQHALDQTTESSQTLSLHGPRMQNFLLWICLVPGVLLAQSWLAPDSTGVGIGLERFALLSIRLPGVFLVSAFAYYGALTVLCVPLFRRLFIEAGHLGVGILGVIAFGLAVNLCSESRFVINIVPFVVLPLVLAIDNVPLKPSQWAFVLSCQLMTSKVWLPMKATASDFSMDPTFQTFPTQYFFSSHGPWMADRVYLLQGTLATIAVVIAVLLFFREPGGLRRCA